MVIIALRRRNWIFCGNQDSAENVAITYSVIACYKIHNVKFYDWMIFFLKYIHKFDQDYSKDLAELRSHNYKKANWQEGVRRFREGYKKTFKLFRVSFQTNTGLPNIYNGSCFQKTNYVNWQMIITFGLC